MECLDPGRGLGQGIQQCRIAIAHGGVDIARRNTHSIGGQIVPVEPACILQDRRIAALGYIGQDTGNHGADIGLHLALGGEQCRERGVEARILRGQSKRHRSARGTGRSRGEFRPAWFSAPRG